MNRRHVFLFVAAAASVGAGYQWGGHVDVNSQRALYESLRTTAGIVFGVVGAWIAVLYPDAKKAARRSSDIASKQERRIRSLLAPSWIATTVLICVSTFGLVSEIVRDTPAAHAHFLLLRACSFSLLCFLTLVLGWAIFLTLLGPDFAQEDIEEPKVTGDAVARLQSTSRHRATGS